MVQVNKNALAPSDITSQLVLRPGHWYWDNRKLTADRFLYSFVNRKEPTCFGGLSHTSAAGSTSIIVSNIYDSARPINSAYQAHIYQTPTSPLTVNLFSAADWITATGMVVGEYIEFSFTNLGTGANAITIAASSQGFQEIGDMEVSVQSTSRFRIYISVIGSGIEAGSLIRIN
tara:strand:- start:589 stop:1110 length:522 start_codon:yes stop_codon:yes gene_type:complete